MPGQNEIQPAHQAAPKKQSPPLTNKEAEEQGGELVDDGKKFRCHKKKCDDKVVKIKNTKKDVTSHIIKHHKYEDTGIESGYQKFLKDAILPYVCPKCLGVYKSASKFDTHRRRKHDHRSGNKKA